MRKEEQLRWAQIAPPTELTIVVLAGVVSYFVFISHYLIHNHYPRLPWVPPDDSVINGRWFNYILSHLHYNADIPVFLPLMGIVMAVFTAYISLKVWDLTLDTFSRILTATAIVTFPFALSFFYYTFMTPLFYSSWCFAALAAWYTRVYSPLNLVIGTLFILLTFASYQASIGVFAVLVVTAAIADIAAKERIPEKPLGHVLLGLASAGVALILGLLLYAASLKLLAISPPGKTSIPELMHLPSMLWDATGSAFLHLWKTQPELMRGQKVLLAIILGAAVLMSAYRAARRSLSRLLLIVILWFLAVLGSKLIFLIVHIPPGSGFEYRYATALAFLHAFSIAYVLAGLGGARPVLRYALIALVAVVVLRFVQADLVRQAILLRGQQHDLAIANRILSRIETLPELDLTQKYEFVRIGRYSDYRQRLMAYFGKKKANRPGDSHMDWGEITDVWVDEAVFKMLGSSVRFKPDLDAQDAAKKSEYARKNLLNGRKPWPDASSVFIINHTVYVYMR
jgi:hypothetical protein